MSTPIDTSLFVDVADAIGLGNPAIVEKDYYVVQLLKLLSEVKLDYHQVVFSGGTALAKSSIKTYRMSEDVDIKLVPVVRTSELNSRSARKNVRRAVKQQIATLLSSAPIFFVEQEPRVLNEYQYFCFDIRYPQEYKQAPCLRPFIKLEFVESELLGDSEDRNIQSIYAQVLNQNAELDSFTCASILDTQAEKLLSMLRRTASVARNGERDDDETLIRHVYDTYYIQKSVKSNLDELSKRVAKALNMDIVRYGNQHEQLVVSPIEELRYGLALLQNDPVHEARYNQYVSPMVYAENPVAWAEAMTVFRALVNEILDHLTLINAQGG